VPALLKDLLTERYAEIRRRDIDVYAVVREPGVRASIAVDSEVLGPVELVGDGAALQKIVGDSGDPIIDVIATDPDPAMYVCNALGPSSILRIGSDATSREFALVIADHEPLDLIHFQLACDLVGWSLTVSRQSDFEQHSWDVAPIAWFKPPSR
jgi:transcription termination/antitermination protein NusA